MCEQIKGACSFRVSDTALAHLYAKDNVNIQQQLLRAKLFVV